MVQCLKDLGFRVTTDWPSSLIHVSRGHFANPMPATEDDVFVGNAGTTMRFLTAMVSLGQGRFRLDGVSRMRERPIEDLLCALRQLDVDASSEERDGYPPVIVNAKGIKGGRARIKGDVSSQFL